MECTAEECIDDAVKVQCVCFVSKFSVKKKFSWPMPLQKHRVMDKTSPKCLNRHII